MRTLALMLSLCVCFLALADGGPVATTRPSRIVFALDAGGAMMSAFDEVRNEVKARVGALEQSQSFNVLILDPAKDGVLLFRDKPVSPTQDVQDRLSLFLNQVSPRNTPDLVAGMKVLARSQADEVVLFISPDRASDPKDAKALAAVHLPPKMVFRIHSTGRRASPYLLSLAKNSGGEIVDEKGNAITDAIIPEAEEKGRRVPTETGHRQKP